MLTAVPALQLRLTRAGDKLLAVVALPLTLLEYHSYDQKAQHVRVVLSQP